MPHRPHAAVRLARSDAHKYLEVFIWMLIGLVVFVMIRFVLVDHGLRIEITEEAKEFLIEKGTNTDFGARPLRRAIEQHVEDPLSEDILRGAFKGKDLIKITVKSEDEKNKHLYFEALTAPPSTTGDDSSKKQLAQASSDAT